MAQPHLSTLAPLITAHDPTLLHRAQSQPHSNSKMTRVRINQKKLPQGFFPSRQQPTHQTLNCLPLPKPRLMQKTSYFGCQKTEDMRREQNTQDLSKMNIKRISKSLPATDPNTQENINPMNITFCPSPFLSSHLKHKPTQRRIYTERAEHKDERSWESTWASKKQQNQSIFVEQRLNLRKRLFTNTNTKEDEWKEKETARQLKLKKLRANVWRSNLSNLHFIRKHCI